MSVLSRGMCQARQEQGIHTSFRARNPSSQSVNDAATKIEAVHNAETGSENWKSQTTGGMANTRSTVRAVGMDMTIDAPFPLLAAWPFSSELGGRSLSSLFVGDGMSPSLDKPLEAFKGRPLELLLHLL